jgi:cell wall assembly regulator SMI1
MHPIASSFDYNNLIPAMQDKIARLLRFCRDNGLSCRCETNGRDFTVIIAPGLSAASWWLERLLIDD